MTKLLVGLDIDEILAPFTEYFLPFYNSRNNTTFSSDDIHYFELERNFGGTGQEIISAIFDFYKTREFLEMPPVKDSQYGTNELKKRGYELIAITSRPEKIEGLDLKELTLNWLEHYFPSALSETHFTSEFVSNGHTVTKADVCERFGVNVFVDDRYGYAKGCAQRGIKTLLYDCPWNRNKEMLPNMERVLSWEEILTKL